VTTEDTNDLTSVTDKAQLRKALRASRRALAPQAQQAAAEGLLSQLLGLPSFIESDRIALYLANDGEIDPVRVIHWCQQQGRKSYLPVVRQHDGRNSLVFAEVVADSEFIDNRFGIPEPVTAPKDLIQAQELDLVLLPLVGFDQHGNRIGMGGGFYDTTFEFLKQQKNPKPELVGIAHEIQRVGKIEAESWDVPLTTVVTDENIYTLTR